MPIIKVAQSLRSILIATLLTLSSQYSVAAGELVFGKDDEWVIFRGPIVSVEVDNILAQLDEKNQN